METEVQLLCPDCNEAWSQQPEDLPEAPAQFRCTHCGLERKTSEFTRTKRDLKVLKAYHES